MEIYGYKRSYWYTFLTWLAILATGFLLRLVFYWKPQWMLYFTHRRCTLDEAEKVLLIDKYNQYFVEKVNLLTGIPHPSTLLHKGTHHQPDEDEILRCPDEFGPKKRYGKLQYGSLISREDYTNVIGINGSPPPPQPPLVGGRTRRRTLSSRSNKSTLTSDNDDQESSPDDGFTPTNDETLNQPANPFNFAPGDKDVNVIVIKEKAEAEIDGDTEQQTTVKFSCDPSSNYNKEHLLELKGHQVRYFENKKIRYIWDEDEGNFVRLRGFDKNFKFTKSEAMTKGLSRDEQRKRAKIYGENAIHVEVEPYLNILFQEVLGPFYIFQLFSIGIWFNDDYYYYGTCIIIMSITSLVSSVIQIRRNQEQLRDTVESVDYIKVCRGKDQYEDIESSKLVPGDVVVVPTFNSTLQFDGILINGNVIVNESMLTGESVPVTKTPFPLQNYTKSRSEIFYDEKEHSKHTLFCGTKVLQTRYYGGVYVKALVTRTGFQTAKGELIRSIMFPKPVDFRFNRQIHRFIGVLACLAGVGFTYSIVLKTQRGADLKMILISALDLITIVIPPALPAAMTVGIIYAQSRLKNNKIFCISPRSINISGCINCVCFDKTGTLTEDNLSFNEVVPLIEAKCEFGRPFDEDVMQTDSKKVERDHHLMLDSGDYSPLMICLASCHSLTIIDQKVIGDPLDLQMFEATGWVLEEPDVDDENKFDLLAPTVVRPPRRKRKTPPEQETYAASSEFPSSASGTDEEDIEVVTINTNRSCQKDVGILRQFPFSSSLQRMSVITRQFGGNQYVVYAKGAPEKIASLCDPETIPDDFTETLHGYTRRGFRVLALAYRPLKVGLSYTRMQRATRNDIEKDLRFLGLLTLGNLLKPETVPVIDRLNRAAIRTVMVTGDNMLTAISVANECGMISPHDKTILLQVERMSRKGERSATTSEENLKVSPTKEPQQQQQQPVVEQPAENRLVVSVDSIQMQTRKESEPILSARRLKEPQRPKLVWHYVNNNEQQQQPSTDFSSLPVDPKATKSSSSVLVYESPARIHLALTGDTWEVILKHYPELLDTICVRGTVFARMAPHQKQQLVEHLQTLQYYVGMCGDGANDSGALRSAHAGISLSDTEASVAAPFTSANANISCVPTLISEGRAALVTAFGILKYMALYSLIQFCSVLLLYTMYTNFTDMQFLYEDLFIIASFVALFGRTEPYPMLDSKAPPSSLMSVTQLSSISIQLTLVVFFQVLSLVTLWQNPWYEPHPKNYDHDLDGHDNFSIFAMSSFQCISLAVVFSKGKPYRKSILSNRLLTGALLIITMLTVTIVIVRAEWNVPYISLEVMNVGLEFRLIMILLAATHFVAAMIGERFIVDHLIFKKSEKFLEILGIKAKVPIFEAIDRETRNTRWLSALSKENQASDGERQSQ